MQKFPKNNLYPEANWWVVYFSCPHALQTLDRSGNQSESVLLVISGQFAYTKLRSVITPAANIRRTQIRIRKRNKVIQSRHCITRVWSMQHFVVTNPEIRYSCSHFPIALLTPARSEAFLARLIKTSLLQLGAQKTLPAEIGFHS